MYFLFVDRTIPKYNVNCISCCIRPKFNLRITFVINIKEGTQIFLPLQLNKKIRRGPNTSMFRRIHYEYIRLHRSTCVRARALAPHRRPYTQTMFVYRKYFFFLSRRLNEEYMSDKVENIAHYFFSNFLGWRSEALHLVKIFKSKMRNLSAGRLFSNLSQPTVKTGLKRILIFLNSFTNFVFCCCFFLAASIGLGLQSWISHQALYSALNLNCQFSLPVTNQPVKSVWRVPRLHILDMTSSVRQHALYHRLFWCIWLWSAVFSPRPRLFLYLLRPNRVFVFKELEQHVDKHMTINSEC